MVERTVILGVPPPPVAWLVIRAGSRSGKEFRLGEQTTIGRDALVCDFVLDDESASAQHARIKEERGQWVLYDLASTNGTFLNGQKIQRAPLTDGDVIRIGLTTMVFKEVKSQRKE